MTPEVRKRFRSWHRLQSNASSCVAACRAIVDARSGGDGIEEPAYPALEGRRLDPKRADSIKEIEFHVRRPACAIVTVHPAPWMVLARLEKRRSPYGDLGGACHAIVIVQYDPVNKIFVVLDPYFNEKDQPIHVSRDDFAAVWTGEVEFVDP